MKKYFEYSKSRFIKVSYPLLSKIVLLVLDNINTVKDEKLEIPEDLVNLKMLHLRHSSRNFMFSNTKNHRLGDIKSYESAFVLGEKIYLSDIGLNTIRKDLKELYGIMSLTNNKDKSTLTIGVEERLKYQLIEKIIKIDSNDELIKITNYFKNRYI